MIAQQQIIFISLNRKPKMSQPLATSI